MKNFIQKHLEVAMAICVAIIYMGVKSVLGLFMSDELSWVGLSLLVTYVIYDVLKMKNGSKE